jgi:uncharacterized 2Fe-2S/4Fe-4S cluster protein (DUF4445 family)
MNRQNGSASYRVVFQPMGLACEAAVGRTIYEVAAEQDLDLRSDCGGKGRCGKCVVEVDDPGSLEPPTANEQRWLTSRQLAGRQRLACEARIAGPVTVTLATHVLDDGEVLGKTQLAVEEPTIDPMVHRYVLPKAPFAPLDQTDGAQYFKDRFREAHGRTTILEDLDALRAISRPVAYRDSLTVVDHDRKGITTVLPGERPQSLGVAVDVGTTTLALYLCDMARGVILSSAGAANPQRRFGEDVITRITYADDEPSGAAILHRQVIDAVNDLIGRCLEVVGANKEEIDEVTVVGNTTMEQLFVGLHPHGLGFSPYLPVHRQALNLRAAALGLDLNPGTNVYVFPVISGFVGGDTMGAILCEQAHDREEMTLIVDIGTNGELVLGNRAALWVTSCATGPALEGAHIRCGMRATSGAIHKVQIDPDSYEVTCDLLGHGPETRAKGICGSGIIDAVAGMLRSGAMRANGRLREGLPGVVSDHKGIGREFVLADRDRTATGEPISIALTDIREIQLAKGALFVGIKLLMRRAGITRVDRMVLTGAFGAHFDWRNAVAMGMLPEDSTFSEVKVVENAAGVGAVMALLNKRHRREAEDLLQTVRFVELAEDPDFAVEFPMAMTFPKAGGGTPSP